MSGVQNRPLPESQHGAAGVAVLPQNVCVGRLVFFIWRFYDDRKARVFFVIAMLESSWELPMMNYWDIPGSTMNEWPRIIGHLDLHGDIHGEILREIFAFEFS